MARYTSAYSQFIGRMSEIESILSVARGLGRIGNIRTNLQLTRGLCRGGIVLLCGHIEGYIEDLVTLGITRLPEDRVRKEAMSSVFKFHLSRDLILDISSSTNPEVVVTKVEAFLSRDGHIWDSSPHFSFPIPVENFVGRFSTPTHENIRLFFRRFGYVGFHDDLAVQLRANLPICTNMVDQVVHQRNRIAHGDVLAYGTPADLEQMCRLVRLYCRNTDQVVANWFKGIGCIIRN